MSKSFLGRASEVAVEGSALPLYVSSGRLTNAASAQQTSFVAPCDLWILSVHYAISTGFTHASSAISIGTLAVPNAYVNSVNIQNAATGSYELNMGAAAVVSRFIPKGTLFGLGLNAADTTGVITISAVLVPYNPE